MLRFICGILVLGRRWSDYVINSIYHFLCINRDDLKRNNELLAIEKELDCRKMRIKRSRKGMKKNETRHHCFWSGIMPNEVSFIWYVHQTASIHLQNVCFVYGFFFCVLVSGSVATIPLYIDVFLVHCRPWFPSYCVHLFVYMYLMQQWNLSTHLQHKQLLSISFTKTHTQIRTWRNGTKCISTSTCTRWI